MIRKWLVIGIILLFVGVTIAPTINFQVVKASTDDDLVEVATQACGIQGYGNTTVKLTREQYQNLEQYLVEFRARLSQTTTREEAVPVFKEAVVELDKYGLLPAGMSVEQAQRLVTGRFQNKNIIRLQEKFIRNHLIPLDNSSNYFCLIAGKATNIVVFGPLFSTLDKIYTKEGPLFILIILLFGWSMPAYFIYLLLSAFSAYLYFLLPLNLLGQMCFGSHQERYHGEYPLIPSNGSIFSFGINGIKNWIGDFYGGIYTIFLPNFFDGGVYRYIGINVFSGLKFYIKSTHVTHFLGSCFQVKLENVNQ